MGADEIRDCGPDPGFIASVRLSCSVVAPGQRDYGATIGWDGDYDGDLESYVQLGEPRRVGVTASWHL